MFMLHNINRLRAHAFHPSYLNKLIIHVHATHTHTHTHTLTHTTHSLTQVEGAVAQRAERGNLQLASVFGHINMLRAELLGCEPSGMPVLPHCLANTVG
jgi:hypothetical protein